MSELIDIIISAIDEASSTFESITGAANDMQSQLNSINGDEIEEVGHSADEAEGSVKQLGDGAREAGDDVENLGDEAEQTGSEVENLGNKSESSGATMQMAFQNIADGVMRAKEGVVELGRNLMETLSLAGQQEQQETFLKMNIGAEGAAKQMKIINELVADLPGDDVAIGGLLSQAAAKNAGITADELERMGTNAADYFAAMSNYGKSSVEAQQDLTNYILTGNTAELERSPVLQGHIDKLKEATTVEERNKALAEAMGEEGWSNISQQETYNNKLETFTAMLDRGKRNMGEMFLDAAGGAMDFIGNLDKATGGVLGVGLAIATVATGPIISMLTGVSQMATGIMALKDAYQALNMTELVTNAIEGQGVIARIAGALGITTEAAAAEGATAAFWGLSIAEGAALWPILAIVAAIAILVVAIYGVGKAFGWWTDVGSMIEAISAGLQRMWNAFVNHPDVQALIQAISSGWEWLSGAIGRAWQAVLNFFGISSSSNFDVISALIQGIGAAWDMIREPVMAFCDQVMLVLSVIASVIDGNMSMSDAVIAIWNGLVKNIPIILMGLGQLLGTIWATIGSLTLSAVRSIISGIVGWFASLPGRILAYLTATRNYIFTQMLNWVQVTRQRAMQIITGILTFFRTLPGRVLAILTAVGRHILSQGMQWIVNAKTRATGVVNGVINLLTLLPGKVLSALAAVAKSIAQAGLEWISTAKDYASKIVSAIVDGLKGVGDKVGSALGGVKSAVQNALSGALDTAKSYASQINNTISNIRTTPGGASGGFDLDANGNPIIETSTGRHDVLDVNISLRDVPDGVDETFLVEVITSRSVIDALVNNQYYQSANSTANLRYQGKVLRSG